MVTPNLMNDATIPKHKIVGKLCFVYFILQLITQYHIHTSAQIIFIILIVLFSFKFILFTRLIFNVGKL